MSKNLYTKLTDVNSLFYKYNFDHRKIANNIDRLLKRFGCKEIVFFGGFWDTAQVLQKKGYQITFVDYTNEMVNAAKRALTGMNFKIFDMRSLKLAHSQDAIILMGRIMTYMYSDKDVLKALRAFKRNLKSGGIVIVDNYETGKIDKGNYFNGKISCKSENITVNRISKMKKFKDKPSLYKWDGIYEKIEKQGKQVFEDPNHILRAFTKDEFQELIEQSGLKFINHYPNFEKRSFISIAQKI